MLYESPAGTSSDQRRGKLIYGRFGVHQTEDRHDSGPGRLLFLPEPDHEIMTRWRRHLDSGMRVRLALDQPELNEPINCPFSRTFCLKIYGPNWPPSKFSARDLQQFYNLIARWHGPATAESRPRFRSAPQRVSKDPSRT